MAEINAAWSPNDSHWSAQRRHRDRGIVVGAIIGTRMDGRARAAGQELAPDAERRTKSGGLEEVPQPPRGPTSR